MPACNADRHEEYACTSGIEGAEPKPCVPPGPEFLKALGVTRLLVSGTNCQLIGFHCAVAMHLNGLERRGQTVLYICRVEDREGALRVARLAGVTVQEWNDEKETWDVIHQGTEPGWIPPAEGGAS